MLTELSAVLNILPGDSLIPGESHSTLVTEQTSLMFALPARTALTPRSSAALPGRTCKLVSAATSFLPQVTILTTVEPRALPSPALHCIVHD